MKTLNIVCVCACSDIYQYYIVPPTTNLRFLPTCSSHISLLQFFQKHDVLNIQINTRKKARGGGALNPE